VKDSRRVFGAVALVAAVAVIGGSILTGGCGSSGSRKSPTPPNAIIHTPQLLVDVGQQALVDGSASFDSEHPNDELSFFWSLLLPANSRSTFQDHCETDNAANGSEVCTFNDDMTCTEDPAIPCTSNADCAVGDTCNPDSGTTSPQCAGDTRCNTGEARTMDYATFVPDVGGVYEVRLLVEASDANNITTRVIGTNPSLFVVGPLFEFGGTLGGFVEASADAQTFAQNAVAGASNPADGNILLAVPSPPRVREFDWATGDIIGTFGETGEFNVPPVALAFDDGGNLNVAYSDGVVRVFDGGNGLFVGNFGIVAVGGQGVVAMAFSPLTGDLFVVDGAAGAPLRVYNPDGSFDRSLPSTAANATRAIDLVFDDPTSSLLIADAGGAKIVSCNTNGNQCGTLGDTATLLAGRIPSAIALNPAPSAPVDAAVLVTDAAGRAVIGCSSDGTSCSEFGQTQGQPSPYVDLFFAPTTSPSTTTTTLPEAAVEFESDWDDGAGQGRSASNTSTTSTTSP